MSLKTTETTTKAQRTKEHILNTALDLFAKKGYPDTTLRDIAKEANVSLGLAYRYFTRKEDLLLSLYERLAAESAEEAKALPKGKLADRFALATGLCVDRLQIHRSALGSLFAVGLAADSEMAVLGDKASTVRSTMWNLYRDVVLGSSDAPKEAQAEQVATILYAAHLLTVLFFLQDRSEGQQKTRELIGFARSLLKKLRPVLGLPIVAGSIRDIDKILAPMFAPRPS